MKNLRRIASRSEKLAVNFEAMFTSALVAHYATRNLSDVTLVRLRECCVDGLGDPAIGEVRPGHARDFMTWAAGPC